MLRALRFAFALAAGLFLAAIVVQVLLAGVGLFGRGFDTFANHRQLGWLLPLGPVLVLLLAGAARAGSKTIWLSVGLLVLVAIQPVLPWLRADIPLAAALHPVNALAIFWVAVTVTRRAVALALRPVPAPAGGDHVAAADLGAAREVPERLAGLADKPAHAPD